MNSPFLIFVKFKLQNWLTTNLDLVVRIYAQDFYALYTFLFMLSSHIGMKLKYQCKMITNLIVSNPFKRRVSLVEPKKNTHMNQNYKGYQNKSNPTF